jgi:hypothetical protein
MRFAGGNRRQPPFGGLPTRLMRVADQARVLIWGGWRSADPADSRWQGRDRGDPGHSLSDDPDSWPVQGHCRACRKRHRSAHRSPPHAPTWARAGLWRGLMAAPDPGDMRTCGPSPTPAALPLPPVWMAPAGRPDEGRQPREAGVMMPSAAPVGSAMMAMRPVSGTSNTSFITLPPAARVAATAASTSSTAI